MSTNLHRLAPDVDPAAAFEELGEKRLRVAPVLDDDGRLIGVITRKGALRSTIYQPAVDADGKLLIGAAVGINGDPAVRAKELAALRRRRARHRHRARAPDPHARARSRRSAPSCPTSRSSPATW